MSDEDKKTRFFGVTEEKISNAQQKRRTQEQWEDYFSNSIKTMRGNGEDMTKIRTPRLDKMRKKLSQLRRTTGLMATLSVLFSAYFVFLHGPVKAFVQDEKERRAYEKLTEEEKKQHDAIQRVNREIEERKEYGGKLRSELTEEEMEYYRQKHMQEYEAIENGENSEFNAEFREYMNGIYKNVAITWAPTIFMLFLYLGRKKRAGEHEQAAADAANFMLDWAEIGHDYAIDPKMLTNIMNDRFARDVIAYMAPTEAVWFEMLLDGNVEIAENPDFRNMATTIMSRYLERHPEAIDVIMKKCDRDSIAQIQIFRPGNTYSTVPTSGIRR